MIKKISDKDKKDWNKFLNDKEKLSNKDFSNKKYKRRIVTRKIDLHGYSLEEANQAIYSFINQCFHENVSKIIVITGKGLRSNNELNPYASRKLSILKYSVPEFIESHNDLTNKIIEIKDANIEDGGGGAFYIFLRNNRSRE